MESIVSMTGRLGTNVELRKTQGGHDLATFRLASSRRYFHNGDWVDSPTMWLTVKCFRNFATNVAVSLRKGQAVVVVGRLELEQWTSQTGEERERMVLHAHAIGHDLNWGITTLHRLQRDRVEPQPGDEFVPEQENTGQEATEQGGTERDLVGAEAEQSADGELMTPEEFVAAMATPIGAR